MDRSALRSLSDALPSTCLWSCYYVVCIHEIMDWPIPCLLSLPQGRDGVDHQIWIGRLANRLGLAAGKRTEFPYPVCAKVLCFVHPWHDVPFQSVTGTYLNSSCSRSQSVVVGGSWWLLGPAGGMFVFHSRTCGRRQHADLMHRVPPAISGPILFCARSSGNSCLFASPFCVPVSST